VHPATATREVNKFVAGVKLVLDEQILSEQTDMTGVTVQRPSANTWMIRVVWVDSITEDDFVGRCAALLPATSTFARNGPVLQIATGPHTVLMQCQRTLSRTARALALSAALPAPDGVEVGCHWCLQVFNQFRKSGDPATVAADPVLLLTALLLSDRLPGLCDGVVYDSPGEQIEQCRQAAIAVFDADKETV